MKCININDWSLWHILSMHFIVQISFTLIRVLKLFNLPFPSFMKMLIGTHSHGSAKQWSHNSLCMHGYICCTGVVYGNISIVFVLWVLSINNKVGLVLFANIYLRYQCVVICRRWLYSLLWNWNWIFGIRTITPY